MPYIHVHCHTCTWSYHIYIYVCRERYIDIVHHMYIYIYILYIYSMCMISTYIMICTYIYIHYIYILCIPIETWIRIKFPSCIHWYPTRWFWQEDLGMSRAADFMADTADEAPGSQGPRAGFFMDWKLWGPPRIASHEQIETMGNMWNMQHIW